MNGIAVRALVAAILVPTIGVQPAARSPLHVHLPTDSILGRSRFRRRRRFDRVTRARTRPIEIHEII
jgi:hypothetical protein